MKSFKAIREEKKDKEETSFQTKVGKTKIMIKKDTKGFTVYIDGEKLDTYSSMEDAKKMSVAFAKELQ
jgi:hypothetical protein